MAKCALCNLMLRQVTRFEQSNWLEVMWYAQSVVGNYILCCMCVLCICLTFTYNSLQLTSNKKALMMEANKRGERQGVVLKSK